MVYDTGHVVVFAVDAVNRDSKTVTALVLKANALANLPHNAYVVIEFVTNNPHSVSLDTACYKQIYFFSATIKCCALV